MMYYDIPAAEVLHMYRHTLAFIVLLLLVVDAAKPVKNLVKSVSVGGGVNSPWSGPRLHLILSHLVVYICYL